ncbi:hypothetical protein GWI33_015047 [Rhynchophorus ferrugineus]|uniref:Uncharacterized protein n=1 Tax=Rhynchophorus ferrugineus TaxID=354439 RepID=A0A834M8H3_RHYFE|nr:hypothetical protein GWI33_015047 [Rhynchophorus ferrugineus]
MERRKFICSVGLYSGSRSGYVEPNFNLFCLVSPREQYKKGDAINYEYMYVFAAARRSQLIKLSPDNKNNEKTTKITLCTDGMGPIDSGAESAPSRGPRPLPQTLSIPREIAKGTARRSDGFSRGNISPSRVLPHSAHLPLDSSSTAS